MKNLIKAYNNILQLLLVAVSIIWVLGLHRNDVIKVCIFGIAFLFIILTFFVSYYINKDQKIYKRFSLILVYILIIIAAFVIKNNGVSASYLISMISIIVLPLCLIITTNAKVSDRVLGLITMIVGVIAFLKIGNEIYIREVSYVLVPCSFVLVFCERNLILRILYVFSNAVLIDQLIGKLYITIFFVLIETAISVKDDDEGNHGIEITYLLIYLLSIVMIILKYVEPLLPITLLIASIANRGFIKYRLNLVFTAKDLSYNETSRSLVTLINDINYNKYYVTLMLEDKKGELLSKVNKEVYVKQYKEYNSYKYKFFTAVLKYTKRTIYSLFNYQRYDFSCCYDTNSKVADKLAVISSSNSCLYIHSTYKNVYKIMKNTKMMDSYRRIVFVSNESRNNYVELYKDKEEKTLVINNFVDVDYIIKKSKEKIDLEKPKKKVLLAYIGTLDEDEKKVSRIIEIAKEIDKVNVWIIGAGKDKSKYEKLIESEKLEDKVQLLGNIVDPYNYMEKADYIILTSDYEEFPVIYLESLVLNKEIITTISASDPDIDMKDKIHLISKNKYVEDVRSVLKGQNKNDEKMNLKAIQTTRKLVLEDLFKGKI